MVGCFLDLILKKGDWDELTGHPKDHGKDRLNSRTNSLQPGEDDADQTEFGVSLFLQSIS
jgi:hypothetical protein